MTDVDEYGNLTANFTDDTDMTVGIYVTHIEIQCEIEVPGFYISTVDKGQF